MLSYSYWVKAVTAQVIVLLILLMFVWAPEWTATMPEAITYPAGTRIGSQGAYWWGAAVGALSMTTIFSMVQLWQTKKESSE